MSPLVARLLAFGACLLRVAAAQQSEGRDLPDVSQVGIPAVKDWARGRIAEGERAFQASGLLRNPSPAAWDGLVVYQIQVDRFNNGNVSNDDLNLLQDQVEGMANGDMSGLPNWRHGGDLQGIRDRLGYLADLGVQALWITPVLGHTGGYHGYCTSDPTTTDPGFGSPEELRGLVKEAHSHGILVVLDVVINHLCDVSTRYTGEYNHTACTDSLAVHFWEGNTSVEGQAHLDFAPSFFPPLRSQQFFNRCGANTLEQMHGDGPATVFGDFVDGMFDYRTDDVDFQEIFTDLHKYWIAYADLDGFRLDAAKHVTHDFKAHFSTEVRAYAGTIGKEDFFIIGEVAAEPDWQATTLGDMEFLEPHLSWDFKGEPKKLRDRKEALKSLYESLPEGNQFPGLPSIYNFNMSGTARSALQCFNNSAIIQEWFSSEGYDDITVEGARPTNMWTLLEIHDWVRFLTEIPDRADLLQTGVAWLMTTPGAPVLYYGVEQGFNGHCPAHIDVGSENATGIIEAVCASTHCEVHPKTQTEDCHSEDSLKRQDMFASGPWRLGSAVPEVNDLAFVGETQASVSYPWQHDPMLRRDHDVYRSIRGLAHLRGSCSALARGRIEWHDAAETPCGVMAFSRYLADDSGSDVFVIINPGGSGSVNVSRLATNRTAGYASCHSARRYVNVFNVSDTARPLSVHGRLVLELANPRTAAGEVRIFVAEDSVVDFDEELGVALCKEAEVVGEEPARRNSWFLTASVLGLAMVGAGLVGAACMLRARSKATKLAEQADSSV